MDVIYGIQDGVVDRPAGVGLGNFDGLHIGHMALINTLIMESKLNGLYSVVYTFTKHPENIMRKKLFTPLLTTVGKKMELLGETSLNCIYFDEFDEDFSRTQPESFVKEILVKKLKIKLAVAGFDYRFGYRSQGDAGMLKEFGKLYNFKVIIIPPIMIDNEIVSSTLIRSKVAKGDLDAACRLLGRHYSITGQVRDGRRIGNKIGFPTANIHPEDYLILPHDGVYTTKTMYDGILYNSLTNIGNNPTFGECHGKSVETHILDFNRDIYDRNIEVFFLSRLRGERKFGSRDGLIRQIKLDIRKAREYFGTNGN